MINYSGLKRISFPMQAPDPFTPFIQAVQGLAGRAPQMSADMQRQEANKYRRAALDRMVQGAGMQAPQMEQGMDGKQALGVLLASLFGRALGANPGEINDFVAGFTQARQNQASQANEQKMREFEMQQRQNQVLSQADLGYADIAGDEANRLQGYIDRDRANTDAMKTRQSERDWWAQQETMRQEGEAKKQAELTNRAMIRDPRKVEAFKVLGKTPDGRAKLVELAGMDADAAEAARQLTEQELLTQAKTQTENAMRDPRVNSMNAQTEYTQARTQTENVMREPRLQKLQADIQRVFSGIQLDDARKSQIMQRVEMYPSEFQLKAANVYSLIASRDASGGKGEKYFGDGYEAAFKQGLNVSKAALKQLQDKAISGKQLTPDEARAMNHYMTEVSRFQGLVNKTAQAKAEWAKKYAEGGKDPGLNVGVNPFASVDPLTANAGRNPNAGPPVQNRNPGNPKPAPKNNPNPQPKAGGGKSRTVNVGGTAVKVYPKKG